MFFAAVRRGMNVNEWKPPQNKVLLKHRERKKYSYSKNKILKKKCFEKKEVI